MKVVFADRTRNALAPRTWYACHRARQGRLAYKRQSLAFFRKTYTPCDNQGLTMRSVKMQSGGVWTRYLHLPHGIFRFGSAAFPPRAVDCEESRQATFIQSGENKETKSGKHAACNLGKRPWKSSLTWRVSSCRAQRMRRA